MVRNPGGLAYRIALLGWVLILGALPAAVVAVEPAPVDTPAASPETPASISKISLEEVAELRKLAEGAEQTGADDRTAILDLYDKAASKLTEAKRFVDQAEALRKELADAPVQLEQAQAEADSYDSAKVDTSTPEAADARAQLAESDTELTKTRELLQKTESEIDHRKSRRQSIPDMMATSRQQLSDVEQALKAAAATGGSPEQTQAQRVLLLARREFRQRELDSLEQEIKTYDGTTRVWLLRRDNAERRLKSVQRRHDVLQAAVAANDRREADQQLRQASRAAQNAHPAVKDAAAANSELAERNKQLVAKTESVRKQLEHTRALADTIRNQLADLTKRGQASQGSPAMGVLLRSRRDQLPALGPYRRNIRARAGELSELSFAIYDWESQRQALLDVDDSVRSDLADLGCETESDDCAQTATALRETYAARNQILAELISNATIYVTRLEEIEASEQELIRVTQELDHFISEQVLWVRSASPIGRKDLHEILNALENRQGWQSALANLLSRFYSDACRVPLIYVAAVAAIVWLIGIRGRFRTVLHDQGREASRPAVTSYRPTIFALACTVALAAPVPLAVGFVGWRLLSAAGDDIAAYAVGSALVFGAAAYGMLNLVRHTCRPQGLGALHFEWDTKALAEIRRAVRRTEFVVLPLLAIAVGLEFSGDDALINSAGRLAFLSALAVISLIVLQLFRPDGSVASAIAATSGRSVTTQLSRLIAPALVLITLSMIAASAIGYHYTSMQLTRRLLVSGMVIFAGLTLRELMLRWLLVAYRRVAIQHSRERRQALAEAQESAAAGEVVVDPTPQVRLTDINRQARALVSAGAVAAFILAMGLLWSDMLPALSVLSRVELWPSAAALDAAGGITKYITLADLLLAVFAISITWYAGKNVPGLLEIAVLQRLPIDAGARYAARSLTRYALVVAGVVMSLRLIGIGWISVQWLIAAMTVGLGFGLQEIFANFVSGIILLFERPARVGDTVTIGNITGMITRIQIRATTILDWDNKELIVPNKEFVTGNLVNWTLSNPMLRMIIQVGVAYGSDTRLATKLLYQVARENSEVLDDPAPVVVFSEFGQSSLNFELRLFVSDLSAYRTLRHELHLAIDDAFREHNVEIAFPQCDLHVRSLPDGFARESFAPSMLKEGHAA